ncbi:hypothetical protein CEXT_484601 [Caerostris extrusa]|uniref:Uncharacterized protein n=1 Tax=Caerostris extrusa TaxID=172846 RepID=A0AAV4XKT7_CAEEX|nr:hypothetical protein CEXT_484601 [Caerostris extrusa]
MRRNESEELLSASLILLFNVTTAVFSMPRKNLKTKTVNRMECEWSSCCKECSIEMQKIMLADDKCCILELMIVIPKYMYQKSGAFAIKRENLPRTSKSSIFCDATVVV